MTLDRSYSGLLPSTYPHSFFSPSDYRTRAGEYRPIISVTGQLTSVELLLCPRTGTLDRSHRPANWDNLLSPSRTWRHPAAKRQVNKWTTRRRRTCHGTACLPGPALLDHRVLVILVMG